MNRHPKEFIENWVDDLTAEFLHAERKYERSLDRGAPRERALRNALATFLPRKYGVAAGHVVSSTPAWSRQSDVIIYDVLETPVFSEDGDFQGAVLPAEGVYGIIEVKSSLNVASFRDSAEKIADFKRLCAAVTRPTLSDRFGAVFAYRTGLETAEKRASCIDECIEIARSFPPHERIDEIFVLGLETDDLSDSLYTALVPNGGPKGPLDYFPVRKGRRNIKLLLLQLDARLRRARTGTPPDMLSYLFDSTETKIEGAPDPRWLRRPAR